MQKRPIVNHKDGGFNPAVKRLRIE